MKTTLKQELSKITLKSHLETVRFTLRLMKEWEEENKAGISLSLGLIEYELKDIEHRLDDGEQEIYTRSVQDESGMAGEQ